MPARLIVKAGLTDRKEYDLDPSEPFTIGRARDSGVVVKDQRTSRRHCVLEATGNGLWTLVDNKSSNGTYVNRQRVNTRELHDGDVVQVGQATFEFQADAPASRSEKAPADAAPSTPSEADAADAEPSRPVEPPQSPGPQASPEPEAPPEEAEKPAHDKTAGEEDGELDDELKGLFDFLDRIDAGESPASAKKPAEQAGEGVPAAPTAPSSNDKDDGKEEEGGLLDFLRKKKQD